MCNRLGVTLANKIFSIFAGDNLYIPNGAYLSKIRRNQEIIAAHNSGVKVHDLSVQYGVSTSQIYKIIAGVPQYKMAETCMQRLMDKLGTEDAQKVINAFPGANLYVPYISKAENREKRNIEIRSRFDGSNYHKLAQIYGVSVRHIRNIIRGV